MDAQQLLFNEPDEAEHGDAGGAIARITVEGLFGHFHYTLPEIDRVADLSSVLILYGDNGSGKTTILKTLFHLLSPANDRGHRNALARIPFRRFEVALAEGGWIAAVRDTELLGSYTIKGELDDQRISVLFDANQEKKFGSDDQERAFLDFTRKLNLTVYLLSADRTIMSDVLPAMDADDIERTFVLGDNPHAPQRLVRAWMEDGAYSLGRVQRNLPLVRAVQLANDWIRRQAIRATARGTENANTIYTDIIKRIADSPHASPGTTEYDTVALSRTLQELASRNAAYARFQFTSPLQVDEIVSALGRVDQQTAAVIGNVLRPYIDGTRARLDALEKLQKTTASFVENLNSFYTGKSVTFDVSGGLTVRG
jgi:energy-coupling factor transporter ATP-binding protein EcfA2